MCQLTGHQTDYWPEQYNVQSTLWHIHSPRQHTHTHTHNTYHSMHAAKLSHSLHWTRPFVCVFFSAVATSTEEDVLWFDNLSGFPAVCHVSGWRHRRWAKGIVNNTEKIIAEADDSTECVSKAEFAAVKAEMERKIDRLHHYWQNVTTNTLSEHCSPLTTGRARKTLQWITDSILCFHRSSYECSTVGTGQTVLVSNIFNVTQDSKLDWATYIFRRWSRNKGGGVWLRVCVTPLTIYQTNRGYWM